MKLHYFFFLVAFHFFFLMIEINDCQGNEMRAAEPRRATATIIVSAQNSKMEKKTVGGEEHDTNVRPRRGARSGRNAEEKLMRFTRSFLNERLLLNAFIATIYNFRHLIKYLLSPAAGGGR